MDQIAQATSAEHGQFVITTNPNMHVYGPRVVSRVHGDGQNVNMQSPEREGFNLVTFGDL